MEESPVVVMVAGPNGAGKSSVAPGILQRALGVVEYVNADVIARGLSAFNADNAALPAGRVMLQRLDELAAERQSFAFETTGASRIFSGRIHRLREAGYAFLLVYVWVRSADISVERVARRVVLGGHNIPEETIRRRYSRALVNAFDMYMPIADEWRVYDNSGVGNAILLAEGGVNKQTRIHGVKTWSEVLQTAATAREVI